MEWFLRPEFPANSLKTLQVGQQIQEEEGKKQVFKLQVPKPRKSEISVDRQMDTTCFLGLAANSEQGLPGGLPFAAAAAFAAT